MCWMQLWLWCFIFASNKNFIIIIMLINGWVDSSVNATLLYNKSLVNLLIRITVNIVAL